LTKRLRKILKVAVIAWDAASPCLTINQMEISMETNVHVHIEVQGETGVGVGPGLV
jgi:hypothetical protein